MHTLAKYSLKISIVILVLIKPFYASDEVTSLEKPVYNVKRIEISPLPKKFLNLRIDCPGTQYPIGSIWVSDHENSTPLPLPLPYVVKTSEVAIKDLRTESGLRTLDNHNFRFSIFKKEKNDPTILSMEQVFDILRMGNYKSGTYTMLITFSNIDSNGIDISYELLS